MAIPPTIQARDENLDKLKSAFDSWYTIEKNRIEQENQFLQQVLAGRSATQTASQNLAQTTTLVLTELDALISG